MNILKEFYLLLKDEETPIFVSEVIEAVWAKDKRPQVHKTKKTANGYTFTIALPPGISFKDFYSKLDYFKDVAGGNKVNCSITQSGKMAILQISNYLLGDYFKYSFDYPRKGILPIPAGYSVNGIEVVDLSTLPHLLIGGTAGSGKSNAVHVIVNSLLSLDEPPLILIIDLKMSEYNYLENSALLVTEQTSAGECLSRIVQEMKSRQLILKNAHCVNIQKYRQHGGRMQYIVLVIDELAELKDKDAQEDLETLLRLSRAAGICIVAATQRPSSKIFTSKSFGDAKANFTGRICYRTISEVDSRIILDSGEGSKIPKIAGRGILRIGCDLIEIQTPYLDPEGIPYVDQFSPAGLSKDFKTNRNIERVGSIGQPANLSPTIPVLPGSKPPPKGSY